MSVPSIRHYATGGNAIEVQIGRLTVWFSYETPVAFQVSGERRYVAENRWSNTTGKHLGAIDGGDKKSRIGKAEFDARLAEATATEPAAV